MAFRSFMLIVALATFVSVHAFPAEEQIRRIAAGPSLAGPGNGIAPVPPAGAGQDLKTDSTYGYGYYYPYSYYYPRYYAYGYGYPYYSYYNHYSWPYYR
ncbi:hypothetical protein V9T40_009371 [Parthenolecanium corni]|uniref:Uncharacterized protein n=1 Tax=Parthenolecanium corni TaxID=536013 RepID=A0AAN9TSD5_9HEMI